jgi:hypothetical protein
MDDPRELERLRNYKPSIDDLKMRSLKDIVILQKETTSFVQNTLYAFLYNPMIHESGYITVSIHRTREGAEKALEWHRNECRNEWAEVYKAVHRAEIDHPFDAFQSWRIEEIQILD